jgi:hypothetical protein
MKLWSPKEQHLRKHVRTPEITCTRVPIATKFSRSTTAADLCNFAKIRASNQDFNFDFSNSCNCRVLGFVETQWNAVSTNESGGRGKPDT